MLIPFVLGVSFILVGLIIFRWPRLMERIDEMAVKHSADIWEKLGVPDSEDSLRQRRIAMRWGVPSFFVILGFVWIAYSQQG